MPVEAAPLVAQRKELSTADPSGDTWVFVTPATPQMSLIRGEYLKSIEITPDGTRFNVNLYALQQEQIWLCAGEEEIGHIVVVRKGPDGEIEEEPFEGLGRKDMKRREFMERLQRIPSKALVDWTAQIYDVNPEWRFPF